MGYSYPISTEIKDYANSSPRFRKSLKMLNDDDYITMNTIILTEPDTLPPGSEVIGIFFAHKGNIRRQKGVFFKQDFIIKHPNGEYTSVTKTSTPSSQVMPIEVFEREVGAGVHYGTDNGRLNHHYYAISELPKELQAEGAEIVRGING